MECIDPQYIKEWFDAFRGYGVGFLVLAFIFIARNHILDIIAPWLKRI